MRGKLFDSQTFIQEVERRCVTFVNSRKSLTRSALDNSTPRSGEFTNHFRIVHKDERFLTFLAILIWYLPEEDRILLSFELEGLKKNLDTYWINRMLASKTEMFLFLLDTQKWSTQDFFGNIFCQRFFDKFEKYIVPVYSNPKRRVTRLVRRRGYKDKGTWRPLHEDHGVPTKVSTLEEEETRTSTISDTFLLLEGFYT